MKRTVLLCMMMFCVLYAQVPQKTVRTVVSDLSVQASDKALILTWNIDPDAIPHIQELRIFRSHKRISSIPETSHSRASSADSNAAKTEGSEEGPLLIKTVRPETKEYADTAAEQDTTYYYAVAAVEKNDSVYGLISPGLNASITGVSLNKSRTTVSDTQNAEGITQKAEETAPISPVPAETPEVMRNKPLTSLRMFPETPATAQQARESSKNKTKGGTGKVNYKTETSSEPGTEREPEILPSDTSDKGISGDDYSLFVIVDNLIKTKKWPEAQAELKRFLQVNRSEETTARAYFYLGQSLYFSGNYREALACFQKSQVLYPVQSKRRIIETLDTYRIE